MKDKLKQRLLFIFYFIIVCFVIFLIVRLGHFNSVREFLVRIEQASYDIRQQTLLKYKKPNKDIVIITVDDESYEYIMDKYGNWPISRKTWADVINALEKVNPKCLIFDMLFVKPTLDAEGDNALAEAVKNNDNVFLSMNFDNTSTEVRQPIALDKKFKLKVKYGSLDDNDYVTYKNVRPVMESLRDATENVGIVNVNRDDDGVIRSVAPIYKYQDDYYPNLSLLATMKILKRKYILIDDDKIILDENHIIPLDETKRAVLNWYGKNNTYKHYSFWRVIKAINNNDEEYLRNNFEDKIVYIGTTATSLSDVKTVPVDSGLSGVELNATFMNNIIDDNFIKKMPQKVNFILSMLISFIIGYFVLSTNSVFKSVVFVFSLLFIYSIFVLILMHCFNIWISVVLPSVIAVVTFIFIYCEKYLLKSKDYEQTYKLAVTDGLTQLYNHRYFQEQMIIQLNNYIRYKTPFSLIMIDIDFFKKFNDKFGHQSGDAVLKQVANILKKNSRTSDFACRYGGEEMTIILSNTDNSPAVFMAMKICQIVRETKFILANGEKARVTISVGVATVNDSTTKTQELIEYCDKCLYKAKENGRNQVVSEI